ncbi:hypothetical protein BKA81DRAFT_371672 [Phyllosticta paracitricarpa]
MEPAFGRSLIFSLLVSCSAARVSGFDLWGSSKVTSEYRFGLSLVQVNFCDFIEGLLLGGDFFKLCDRRWMKNF